MSKIWDSIQSLFRRTLGRERDGNMADCPVRNSNGRMKPSEVFQENVRVSAVRRRQITVAMDRLDATIKLFGEELAISVKTTANGNGHGK